MSKKCTPLWPKARFEVKCAKHITFGAALAVEMLKKVHGAKPILKSEGAKHITLGAALAVEIAVVRSTFRSQNAKSTRCSDHFWTLRCRKSARGCGAKLHCTTLYTTLHYITTFHHATLHYTTLYHTTLPYATPTTATTSTTTPATTSTTTTATTHH